MNCTRCQGTGFLNWPNIENVPCLEHDEMKQFIGKDGWEDFQVCDCCGNGEDWYGDAGRHYTNQDPIGKNGPYAYNGGLCECH
jgi:hypothetical protein